MSKKKILIFIDWYLPGYKAGGPIQSVANLVAHFKDEFEFSIVTRDTDYCEEQPYSNIKSNEWNTLSDGTKVYYFSKDNLSRSGIRSLIRKTEFDVVYLNGVYSLYFTLIPLLFLRKKKNIQVVIAARGMLSKGSLGVKKTKKKFFITAVKTLRLFDNVIFHATTEIEKTEIFSALGINTFVKVAANLPQLSSKAKLPERKKENASVRIVNIARIAPEKNLLFALKILKSVKADVVFDFYGPIYNQEYWKECKLILDDLPQNVKAQYKGSVESDKVLDALNSYHFMLMPTTGENFGHIILQSLSVGCPVIISDLTPWKQLEEKNAGWEIPLNNSDRYAEIIDFTAGVDQSKYNNMSKAAFDHALEYIQNPKIKDENRSLFL